ncbi:MAG: DUF411 domain-containing protein [Phenylobacterium sp.]|uniref:DUF411 domain-containing protein n=1 Tax=Phenylobacterium sp. TaxID=1871053 RepID=UPI001A2EA5E2|nr:DUF411 domain-containing protein [Phenylobacterium sp.]MBJ7411254.1 DUF411 domain-containing protein [Phenylobacterium sp.]
MLNRRAWLAALPALLAAAPAHAFLRPPVKVYKTASCTCCQGWVRAMFRAGFYPQVAVVEDLTPLNKQHGVPFQLSSCHLSTVGKYVVVGHVPPVDVMLLLRMRPKGLGLTVPGMPLGSPGMETRDGRKEAFASLLLLPGGKTRVFAQHG